MMYHAVLLGLLLSLAANAGPDLDIHKSEYARDKAQFHRRPHSILSLNSEEERNYDITSYDLSASFDWQSNKLSGVLNLSLELEGRINIVTLDSNVTKIKKVELKNNKSLPFTVERGEGLLKVDISSIVQDLASRELELVIFYETDANYIYRGSYVTALRTTPARKGDPNQTRVLSTFSEPEGASFWMPCNDTPADRAKFTFEFSSTDSERVIANGDLVFEQVDANHIRRTKYSTRYSLPTYLMAFAVGDFVVINRQLGKLPLSLWIRRGLQMDYNGMLDALARQMESYEKLLGAYPFEKYALVLLPDFRGGIEHAGITFQGESSSLDPLSGKSLNLTAHELAHQWFGDFVTVKTWDDLWIKEGMATLLAAEASRPYEDSKNSNRLFGNSFWAEDGEAIYEPETLPENKYHSGQYGRSAWLLTQIRAHVGENNFWATLRNILKDHAFGNISTEEFLDYFQDFFGEAGIAKLRKALVAKKLPQMLAVEDNNALKLTLIDSDGALLEPIKLASHKSDGSNSTVILNTNTPYSIDMTLPTLWMIDPQEIHPLGAFVGEKHDIYGKILIPQTAELKKQFLALAPHAQENALSFAKQWNLTQEEYTALMQSLSSEIAKFRGLNLACELLNKEGSAWKNLVSAHLSSPAYLGIPSYSGDLSSCGAELPKDLFAFYFQRMKKDPAQAFSRLADLNYLTKFSSMPAEALETWGHMLAPHVPVYMQEYALGYLVNTAKILFSSLSLDEQKLWQKLFREELSVTQVSTVLSSALSGVVITKDKEAVENVRKLVTISYPQSINAIAFCSAYKLLVETTEEWNTFVMSLGDADKLPAPVQKLLADPSVCMQDSFH